MDRNLKLFASRELGIGDRPARHFAQQSAGVSQAFPHLLRDVRRKGRQHDHERLQRFAHDEYFVLRIPFFNNLTRLEVKDLIEQLH